MSTNHDPRPPRFWALVARLLIHGEDGRLIRDDLAEAFSRDLDRGTVRRLARRHYAQNVLGSVGSVWWGWMRGLAARGALLDAKLGMRMLFKHPMLTGVAMLALALGIPSALTVHHVLNVLLSPLPVPEGERVMGIRHHDLELRDPVMSSVHDFFHWRETLGSFEQIAAARSYLVNINTGDPGAPPVQGSQVSAEAFDVLRIAPLMGRVFGTDDEVRGAPEVVILSEDLWESRFTSDPDIVGRVVRIGRQQSTVVGVMPSSFRFPSDDDVWLPLRAAPTDYPLGEGPQLLVFGRLAEDVTPEQADVEIELVTDRLRADNPERYELLRGEVVEMPILLLGSDDLIRNDPEVLLVQSMMMVLLLIVCGNVGTLILARTATRTGEISIRTALGASRVRIITQLFIEALVLALVATGLGLVAAEGTARWLTRLLQPYGLMPYWMDLSLRPEIIFVALGVAVVSAVVAGVVPAFKATSRHVLGNLQRTAAGHAGIRFGAGSSFLIVSEIVLSVAFLAMGGTLVRGVFQDTEGMLGFEPERYMRAGLSVPWIDPADDPEQANEEEFRLRLAETQQGVLALLEADGDVRGAALALRLPGVGLSGARIVLETVDSEDNSDPFRAQEATVDLGFFRGLGRPILNGRDFTAADVEGDVDAHRPSVIVNTSFVEQALGGRNPIGVRFRHNRRIDLETETYDWFEIVGVVGAFGMNYLNPTMDAGIYYPMASGERNFVQYIVELEGDPSDFAPRFREIVAGIDQEATVHSPMPVDEIMEMEGSVYRWGATMQVLIAGVAFLLSVTGLYALMSFTVSQRTREIGIRTALGARPWGIVSTVARRAAIQLAVGLSLGAVAAWTLLNEITFDATGLAVNIPLTVAFTVVGAAAIGIVACAAPTIRGLRIQPTEALREN